MSYLALYRKYRPDSFEKVFGQKYIVSIIKNAVLNNKISHAYLFSGPRGTGKTTIAKLLSKIVNCSNLNGFEPCDKCNSCSLFNSKSNPDIIEIDAASNNGVDEIRIIRDKVSLLPSVSKYKVYIIDEVHMLSTSAFNALLKTLEEPPAHVIFVLATTELYKVPETIISRCQCYEFERLKQGDIVDCLSMIVDKEKLDVDSEVLKLIADYSNGGMRDSINLLDKLCSCANHVDKKLFYDVVGLVDNDVISDLINNILSGSYNNSIKVVNELEKNGKNINFVISQLIEYLKNKVILDENNKSNSDLLVIMDEFNDLQYKIKYSSNLQLAFEVGILKIVNKFKNDVVDGEIISREIISDDKDLKSVSKKKEKVVYDIADKELETPDKSNVKKDINEQNFVNDKKNNFDIIINNAFATADKNLKNDILSKWNEFYNYVHNKEFSSVVSYLLDSNLEVVGEKDIIISTVYDSVLDGAISNISKIELLFNLVMCNTYNLAFVSSSCWDKLKQDYIDSLKSGKKYEYIESKVDNDVIINNEVVLDDVSTSNVVVDDKSAAQLFGSDIVEIK